MAVMKHAGLYVFVCFCITSRYYETSRDGHSWVGFLAGSRNRVFLFRIPPKTVHMLWFSASRYADCRILMSLQINFQGRVDFKGSAMPLTVIYETYTIMWCNFTKYWLSLIYLALISVWNVWNSCNIRFFTRKCSVCWIFSIEWVNSDGLLCLW